MDTRSRGRNAYLAPLLFRPTRLVGKTSASAVRNAPQPLHSRSIRTGTPLLAGVFDSSSWYHSGTSGLSSGK